MQNTYPIEDIILAPLDEEDIIERSGLDHISPETIEVRIGEQVNDDAYLSGVDAMANDHDDRARPSSVLCASSDLNAFTIAIAHANSPMDPVSLIVLEIDSRDDVLAVKVSLVFTDAEMRGEGLGYLCAAAAEIVIDRAFANWEEIPGTSGTIPSVIEVDGNAVTDGGQSIIDCIQRYSDRLMSENDDFEIVF